MKSRLEILEKIACSTQMQLIADLCHELFGNPVIIHDTGMQPIASSKVLFGEEMREINELLDGQIRLVNIYQSSRNFHEAKNHNQRQKAFVCRDKNISYGRLIRNLSEEQIAFGTIMVIEFFRPFSEEDLILLDLVARYITLPMRKRQYKIYGQWSVDQYIKWLLSGNSISLSMEQEKMNFYEYFPNRYFYLLSIYAIDRDSDNRLMDQLLKALNSVPNVAAIVYKSRIVLIFNSESKIMNWSKEVKSLAEILEAWQLHACVSRCFTDHEEIYEKFLETDGMMERMCLLDKRTRFIEHSCFTFYQLLEKVGDPANMIPFIDERIMSIEHYDRHHNTNLAETLMSYLDNAKSLTKTAEQLFVHKNTANYRINKCIELTGYTFEKGDEIFSAIFSLRILDYYKRRSAQLMRSQDILMKISI